MFNGTNVSAHVPVLYTLAVFFLRQHPAIPTIQTGHGHLAGIMPAGSLL